MKMKKEVKRRIKALQIGIQACQKRMDQLAVCVKIEECPLCEAYRIVGGWSCDQCPAHKKHTDDDLCCDVYADIIEDLMGRLAGQQFRWAKELRKLKEGTKK